MPDDRFFHKRAGHSEKVNRLTDFEELAWRYYIESADDFGVMRFSAISLQNDHDRMARRPAKTVLKAMERVRDIGLIGTFEHQGRAYCYQRDWQDYQKVTYPRPTVHPPIPTSLLDGCSSLTQLLFILHPGGRRKNSRKDTERVQELSENLPEKFQELSSIARAPALATATATAYGKGYGSRQPTDFAPEVLGRVSAFIEHYQELYRKHRKGAHYLVQPQRDFQEAALLCENWDDARLDKMAILWLTTDDPFAESGSRTLAQFRSKASWCDDRLRQKGL